MRISDWSSDVCSSDLLRLNRDALLEILKNGSAGSFSLNVYSSMSSMKDFDHGARLLKKDVNILRDCANSDSAKEILKFADSLQNYIFYRLKCRTRTPPGPAFPMARRAPADGCTSHKEIGRASSRER